MEARARYFRHMEDVMYELMCVNILMKKYKNRETITNIFIAVFSGSGIASWYVWSDYAKYSALAVAASQVVSLAIPYLELRKKIERLMLASAGMQALSDRVEGQWPKVLNDLPDDEIESLIEETRERQRELLGRVNEICSVDDKTAASAEERLNTYMQKHYYEL